MLVFIITLVNMTCIAYSNSDIDLSRYDYLSVDVYESSELSDRVADKLFPIVYIVDNQVYQCDK